MKKKVQGEVSLWRVRLFKFEDMITLQTVGRCVARTGNCVAFTNEAFLSICLSVKDFISKVVLKGLSVMSLHQHNEIDIIKQIYIVNALSNVAGPVKNPFGFGAIPFGLKPVLMYKTIPIEEDEDGDEFSTINHDNLEFLSNMDDKNTYREWEKAAVEARNNNNNWFVGTFQQHYKKNGLKSALFEIGFHKIESLFRSDTTKIDDVISDHEVKQMAPVLSSGIEVTLENSIKMMNEISALWLELERRAIYRMNTQENFSNEHVERNILNFNASKELGNFGGFSMGLTPTLKLNKTLLDKFEIYNTLQSLICRIKALYISELNSVGFKAWVDSVVCTHLGIPNDIDINMLNMKL